MKVAVGYDGQHRHIEPRKLGVSSEPRFGVDGVHQVIVVVMGEALARELERAPGDLGFTVREEGGKLVVAEVDSHGPATDGSGIVGQPEALQPGDQIDLFGVESVADLGKALEKNRWSPTVSISIERQRGEQSVPRRVNIYQHSLRVIRGEID